MALSLENALAMVDEGIKRDKINFMQIELPTHKFVIGYYDDHTRSTPLCPSLEEAKNMIAGEYILRSIELQAELAKSHIEYIRKQFAKLNSSEEKESV